jgi:CheY-like chemotaxis protein
MGWVDRWKIRQQTKRLLRPGRPPANLHEELVSASEQREHWFELVGGGGRPEISPRLDSLTWRLIEQTAWTMNLIVERKDVGGTTTLVLEFPKTAGEEMAGLSATEIDDGGPQSSNSKALAGSHVLVVASRREVRVLIRDALRNMSMLVDFVGSIDEAASFCKEGLPHAIIVDSIQKGSRFTHFREEILDEVPDFVFIEILEQGSTFEMSGTNGAQMARIGRDVVASSLPAALMFELSRGL